MDWNSLELVPVGAREFAQSACPPVHLACKATDRPAGVRIVANGIDPLIQPMPSIGTLTPGASDLGLRVGPPQEKTGQTEPGRL